MTRTQELLNLLRHLRPVTMAASTIRWSESEGAYNRMLYMLRETERGSQRASMLLG